ncbi:MAG: phosphoribosylaminoimidazolesuccinocarboxamide synthase, partial [Chrysiogenales bacterium]
MGSVKDLKVAKKPTDVQAGEGVFTFSDRYSVFDWGEMPDHIDGKGKALCVIGAYFFEKLHDAGIDSHYRGIVDGENGVRRLKEAREAPAAMAVNLYRVIRPAEKGGNY